MSFSKGLLGAKTEERVFDGYRGEKQNCTCAYPNCKNRLIERHEDAVFWDGAHIDLDEFNRVNLSPMAKLAVAANPTDFVQKYGYYPVKIALHAACAAEWGMHLIKDALQSHNVGNILRKEQNAIRKQT